MARGTSPNKTQSVLLIPVPHDSIVLPGVTLRIPIGHRADVAAVLAHIYSKADSVDEQKQPVIIGCVPLGSPYVSPDGKLLIGDGKDRKEQDAPVVDPARATKRDLFGYGTLTKITGVQGRRQGDLALVAEGISRFRLDKVTKERPFFEGVITTFEDAAVDVADTKFQALFTELRQLSRELLALARLSSLLPTTKSLPMSPLLARRLELFIQRKGIDEAGLLADFMTSVAECPAEDKLRVLAALSVKDRLALVNELLTKSITTTQNRSRIPGALTKKVPEEIDLDKWNQLRREAALRKPNGNGFPPGFPGFLGGLGGGNSGGQQGGEEDNELKELEKRLEEAKLSPEAQTVAQRELKRLARMNPAQADYQVCRNYLENLAEIPWTKVTDDKLDVSTLMRARKQLDDDHYGLEKVKKRLLEYLAVLKLKQTANQSLDEQIKHLEGAAAAAVAKTENAEEPQEEAAEEASEGQQEPKAVEKTPEMKANEEQLETLKKKRMIDKSPILLLVGPPGVGKTSLAKSVATSLGRKFHRISLGGVRDEAEIRGHRRTYVAAMPGLIVSGLKKVGVANPVFLLDEIDKVGTSNFHGDPSAAMLEVLDPEQNYTFNDHYVNVPIDLSKVLFIATANTLDTIAPALLDRMETISLPGYTALEKRAIAKRHLIAKQITTNGLQTDQVQLPDDVIDKIVTAYTREAGVRNLEREIGSVCRAKAVQFAESQDSSTTTTPYRPSVTLDDLQDILGIERFDEEIADTSSRPGVVTGLVAYSTGGQGSILFIEIADMPGTGRVQLTGKLGDVLKESVEVALSWVKAHAYALGLTTNPDEDIMKNRAIHVHCPAGAVPKDGPSAGLAHTMALVSLFAGKPVPPTLAMTGEISLRGKVTPVGGIKEKLIGALRAGVKTVLLPNGNKKDVQDCPTEVKEGLEIIHVGHIWEAMRHVWPDAQWPGERQWAGIDSRL